MQAKTLEAYTTVVDAEQKNSDQATAEAHERNEETSKNMHHIKPSILKPNGKQKPGRGFSPNELAKAGVNRLQARQMGLPVDYRRRTAHEDNIASLKSHAKTAVQAKPAAAKKTTA